MADQVTFTPKSAQRIAAAVQKIERMGPPPRTPRPRPQVFDGEYHLRFVIKEIFNNYLRCVTWDSATDTEGTQDYYVAKPNKLLHTADEWDDWTTMTTIDTQTVTVSDGSNTQLWETDRPYELEDFIVAAHMPGGIYDAAGTAVVRTVGDPTTKLYWQDTNRDGRKWKHRNQFPAKITGRSGTAYSWTEQAMSAAGVFSDKAGGRTGTNTAYELSNSTAVATNTIVLLVPVVDADGGTKYVFNLAGVGGLFRVALTQTGGSAGTSGAYCSFTYTVTSLSGVELATAKAPENSRARIVKHACTAGTKGSAYYGADGVLVLWDCDEVGSNQTNCT